MSFKDFFAPGTEKKTDSEQPLSEREEQIMVKLAAKIVEWKMTVPAILFLESVKPLNFIGAQMMVFFEPFVQAIFNLKDYDTFREMMEQRENVERFLLKIEELDAAALDREKKARTERRGRRSSGWLSRFHRKSRTSQPGPPDDTTTPSS